ncbi:hypothetical protein GCM10010156_66550 [Planobispora rosea]|uniref:S-adenosyl methyltransferase n=1 Tax=Planobispora rosea TaxID=35762 RepID=A0A8J3SE14_PLARO|nr:SAM-dependent methyltransferase [Planobispora rosea]GGS99089.1 hypothetical protein GCM10010156_66550 [Planobispora rosea]GIH88018.1 hypothetical protein Pro02_64260 [Planobispora rosea]
MTALSGDDPRITLEVDPNKSTPHGVVDRVTGGSHHTAADEAVADPILAAYPEVAKTALDDRQFVTRVVTHLAQLGIDRFVSLGYRLPADTEVHHVAQPINPRARVVYVSNDAAVNRQAAGLINAGQRIAYINGDLRTPQTILTHRDLRRLIGFTQPVGVLFYGSLNYIPDEDNPWGLVHSLLHDLPAGSYAAFSHVTADDIDPGLHAKITEVYAELDSRFYSRSRDEFAHFIPGGWTLQPPGITYTRDWSVAGDEPPADLSRVMYAWCALALKT